MKKKIERKCWWCRSENIFIEDVDPNDDVIIISIFKTTDKKYFYYINIINLD